MNNCVFTALESLKGLSDDMLPALSQNLNGNVVGNHIIFDKSTQKCVFRLARRREANLNFLKAELYQKLEEIKLLFKAHRYDKRLIAVSQIDRTPNRRFFYVCFVKPFSRRIFDGEKLSCIS